MPRGRKRDRAQQAVEADEVAAEPAGAAAHVARQENMVYLRCVKEGSRLRVRIISPGYLLTANCQFPKAIRAEGRTYKVSEDSVKLAVGAGGTYFYRVNGAVEIITENAANAGVAAARNSAAAARQAERTQQNMAAASNARQAAAEAMVENIVRLARPALPAMPAPAAPAARPATVYDDGDPDCVICLEAQKNRILVPCGHFCLCDGCHAKLQRKLCPLCRKAITTTVTPDQVG